MFRLSVLRNARRSFLRFAATHQILAGHRQTSDARFRGHRSKASRRSNGVDLEIDYDGTRSISRAQDKRRRTARHGRSKRRSILSDQSIQLAGHERLKGVEFQICAYGVPRLELYR